jgi:CheY-like chemotaxis protein
MLPKLNGFEFIREVRAIAPGILGRTVVITAASDATLRDFDRTQVAAVLRKPFEIDALTGVVASLMPDVAPIGDAPPRILP